MRRNQSIKDNLKELGKQCQFLCAHLNEQDRRLVAMTIGWGGNTCVAEIIGMDRETVAKGQRELHNQLKDYPEGKQRLPGAAENRSKKKSRNRPGV